MSELLVTHAKKHLWQVPNQDHQFNIGLARLTKVGGFIGSTKVLRHRVLNPTRDDAKRYYQHVYQVGQISPLTLNIANMLPINEWMPAEDLVDDHNVLIELYFESGAIVPLATVWVMRDYKSNILMCVRIDRDFDYGVLTQINEFSEEVDLVKVNTDNDRLIARFYTNALGTNTAFNAASSQLNDTVGTISRVITTALEWGSFIAAVNQLKSRFGNKGGGLWYKDGFLVSKPPAFNNNMIGGRYTVVWDEAFKFSQMFRLKSTALFKSARDPGYNKYLLVCDAEYDEIDFFDDVDFYLVSGTPTNYKGVYVNRAKERFLRQVTHNGYAVDATLVGSYMKQHAFLNNIDNCWLLVQVRKGGMVQPVLSQANRIDELFRLPYANIMQALYNVNSLVPEWTARELENSAYMRLAGGTERNITPALARDAYGYAGIVNALAHPKQPIINGVVTLPSALSMADPVTGKGCRTLFVYNDMGLLIGTIYSEGLSNTIDVSGFTMAGTVECFRLKLKNQTDKTSFYHNQDVTDPHLEEYGFACYVSGEFNGKASGKWIDVTGTNFYSYSNGKLTWHWQLLTEANLYPCVHVNDDVLVTRTTITNPNNGDFITVNVEALQDFYTGSRLERLNVPVATVDVFVNGEAMIEGVDYYLGGNYPTVIIVNTWANNLPSCEVLIRAYGLGNPKTNKPYPPVDVGFVTEGYLSKDGGYDVSKYRPNSVVVNSRIVGNSKYRFSEYDEGVLYPVDGRPYMVRDYIIPTEHLAPGSSTALYTKMCDIDKRVGGYLDTYVLDQPTIQPQVISGRWSVISPLCAALLRDFNNGFMNNAAAPKELTKTNVTALVKSYLSLLDYDPAAKQADSRYVYVRPHALSDPINVTITQWRFLNLVNDLYLNGRIDFTSFVTIG